MHKLTVSRTILFTVFMLFLMERASFLSAHDGCWSAYVQVFPGASAASRISLNSGPKSFLGFFRFERGALWLFDEELFNKCQRWHASLGNN